MSMLSLTLCFCLAGCHLSLAGWCVFWLAGALLGWLEALPGWLDSLLSWLESLPGRAEIFSGWRMSLFWWLESFLIGVVLLAGVSCWLAGVSFWLVGVLPDCQELYLAGSSVKQCDAKCKMPVVKCLACGVRCEVCGVRCEV